METRTIAIIGLGRIGASIGLALKQSSLQVTLIGHDRDTAVARVAHENVGAVDRLERNLISAISGADIVVLALPVSELAETLRAISDGLESHALLLDLCGLKQKGLEWARRWVTRAHYVGAVPVLAASRLADGRSGPDAARADLFRRSVFCLTPAPDVDPEAVETAVNFGRLLGAVPYFLDPVEYDALVQGVETLPGLAAAAMFNALRKAKGWRDMRRFAGQPFALMTLALQESADAALHVTENREAALRWLDEMAAELQQVRQWVAEGDVELLTAVLARLNDERAAWLREREKNEWIEQTTPEIPRPGLAEHLLGGLARKRREGRDG